MSEPNQNTDKEVRQSSGVKFPKLPLSKVIELGKAVYDLGDNGENSVPKAEALNQIKRAASGGASGTLVATVNAYGVTKISKEKMSLTNLGKIIVSPESSEDEKRQAAYDLLSENKFFADLASRYTERALPSTDKAIYLHLIQNHSFTQKDAETFWSITQENLKDFSLMKELTNGTRMFLPRPTVTHTEKESVENFESVVTSDKGDIKQPLDPQVQPAKVVTGVAPEFHFNIQIHLPENSTPENYDAIFKSIATYLLGRSDL